MALPSLRCQDRAARVTHLPIALEAVDTKTPLQSILRFGAKEVSTRAVESGRGRRVILPPLLIPLLDEFSLVAVEVLDKIFRIESAAVTKVGRILHLVLQCAVEERNDTILYAFKAQPQAVDGLGCLAFHKAVADIAGKHLAC